MATFNKLRHVARVREVQDDGCSIILEFPNGQFTVVDNDEPFEYGVGSILLVAFNETDIDLEPAPDKLWPEQSLVGVVRLKLENRTVIDLKGGRPAIAVPTHHDIEYDEGNTVEANLTKGVITVLSKDPIKDIELPAIEDSAIERFRVSKEALNETYEDFGGLKHVVEQARKIIEIPMQRRELLSKIGARPIKGVLFTGAPGTGKTMLARIIANSTDAAFYQISGPEIFSKWYGQTEEVLRKLFDVARRQPRAIIFFDEIDSIAAQRDDQSHEASSRVVAQLLTLMDGFVQTDNIIVIATSNRPQDIDTALRRPGRFDHEINFPLPERVDREKILQVAVSARKLPIEGDFPHAFISENTVGWSAAELSKIWDEAIFLAAEDNRDIIIPEDYVGGFALVASQRDEKMKHPSGEKSK